MENFNKIKNSVKKRRVRFRYHSAEMLIERNIKADAVYDIILHGEIIEEYPDNIPFPSFLIFGWHDKNPLHVVCSYNDIDDIAIIITTYHPNEKIFLNDYKTRRKKHEK